MIESNISDLNRLRSEMEKQLLNMNLYEEYITDISKKAEVFLKEKGIAALKQIGFNYISHSSFHSNSYNSEREYDNYKPSYFFIPIECTMKGGQWKENSRYDKSLDKKRDIAIGKMITEFKELTGQQLQINKFSLEGDSKPIISILFKL